MATETEKSSSQAPLTPAQLEETGVEYIDDPSATLGDPAAEAHWRVEHKTAETGEDREKAIETKEEIAEPLVDAIAEIQETERALAELWYEWKEPQGRAPKGQRNVEATNGHAPKDADQAKEVGAVASADQVDGTELLPGIQQSRGERLERLRQKQQLRSKHAQSRPKWEEYMPSSTNEVTEEDYEAFLAELPDTLQEHVRYLRKVVEEKDALWTKPEVLQAFQDLRPERYVTVHNASVYGYCKRQTSLLAKRISDMRVNAHQRGRSLSTVEQKMIDSFYSDIEDYEVRATAAITDSRVQAEVTRRENVKVAEQLRKGFVETDQMKDIINVVLPRLAEGLPAAFFGEVGGAKSSLAKHIAREYLAREPIVVDGGPDITMQALFGKTGLEDGEDVVRPGSLARAAEEGRMVIIDEYDTLPARIRTATNGALLWRPGQTVRPFGYDRDIEVKPGFCIVITANLRSNRYDREKLDLSTIDRFEPNGAGVFEIHYPDDDVIPGQGAPKENLLLAMAALTDDKGYVRLPSGLVEPGMGDGLTAEQRENTATMRLIQFVNAAHMVQRFFSDPTAIVSHEDMVPDSQHLTRTRNQGKPVLEQAVLSPRGMLGILRNLTITGENTSLSKELARWVAMQPAEMDRKIISTILASRGLLWGIQEKELKIPENTLGNFMQQANQAQGT